MAEFKCNVERIVDIEQIPDSDNLELVVIGDYRCVVQKNSFAKNQLVIYIPEGSIVPQNLLEEMGLSGRLYGPEKNRVKAIKLRGCLSQGLILGLDNINVAVGEGDNLATLLGITKYEPPLPKHMTGDIGVMKENGPYYGKTIRYDVENIKTNPNVFGHGEWVEFREKLHGTFCGISYYPDLNDPDLFGGNIMVYSKGLGAKGYVFKDNEANANNVYLKTIKGIVGLQENLARLTDGNPIHILGEIYGPGVQDLSYGLKEKDFRVFEIYIGSFLDRDKLEQICLELQLEQCPLLYRGPFSRDRMIQYSTGNTQIGDQVHIREGIVITPCRDRKSGKFPERVQYKSINEDYLLRKDKNATEYS